MLGHTTFATAVLALAIALAPGAASAQADGTVTISGTFSMDWLDGTVGPDLADVFANGHEHTWTLTLHGTTQSHSTYSTLFGYIRRATEIHATSFDLEFFGPDAATLNGIVSEHIAGGDVSVYLENAYSSGFGGDFAVWDVSVYGPDVQFWTEELSWGWNPLFPADAEGYPVVGPDPLTILAGYNLLIDNRPGNDGSIWSDEDSLVTFEVMPDAPSLSITRSNNVVIVSWPSSSTGFSLQQNTQLNTTNWVTATETVTDTGTIKFITVDPPVGSRFFRLFKP